MTTKSQTPFGQLLLAVFNSILQVFIISAAGYVLARRGVLDKRTQKQINRLNVSLFTPALLFSKVAFYLTPEKLKELWIIPIWFVIVTLSSMGVGKIVGWAGGVRGSQKSFITAASMFMNSNALPIALMQSLVVSVPDLAWDKVGREKDNKNAMLGRALTYLTMYSTLGMVVRYSYGVSLLSRADTMVLPVGGESGAGGGTGTGKGTSRTRTQNGTRTGNGEEGVAREGDADERTPLLVGSIHEYVRATGDEDDEQAELQTHPSSSTLVHHEQEEGAAYMDHRNGTPSTSASASTSAGHSRASSPRLGLHLQEEQAESQEWRHDGEMVGSPGAISTTHGRQLRRVQRKNTTFYNSFPNSPNETRAEFIETSEDEGTNDVEAGPSLPSSRTPNTLFSRVINRLRRVSLAIHNFMTVPLWSALLSLCVACFSPLQHALEHHMRPLNDAINVAGKCAVPLTLVVLGAYFYVPPEEDEVKRKRRKKDKRSVWTKMKDGVKLLFGVHHPSSPSPNKLPPSSNRTHPGETKTIILALLSRMFLTPLLLLPLIILAASSSLHAVFDDPVFVTVNTLLLCSPPALTLAQITAAVSGDAFERLVSRTVFWAYCVLTPPVMMASVLIGLWMSRL